MTSADVRPVETATLQADDGVPIDACHDPAAAGTRDLGVIVAHGFTGSWRRPAVRRVADQLRAIGGVVSFDFRGHGRSGGVSTVGDLEVLDLRAAVAWARDLGYRRIATLGFSMGASVTVRHAGLYGRVDDGLAAVVAVSGPARWYYRGTPAMRRTHWVIERPVGRLVSRVMLRTRISAAGWDPAPAPPYELAGRIAPIPLLVVHGDADHYFPLEHAEQLFAAAGEPKELWVEPGFGHAENAASPDLVARIADWIAAR
jgi:pimeloyl-ACP methyl ester carboxylesterase